MVEAILAAMLALSPPTKCPVEPPAERADRYAEIAAALAEAVEIEDADERDAAIVLGITYHESGWHRGIDLGTDPWRRGEATGQWCLGQIHLGRGRTSRGWTGPELVRDRVLCLRETIARARASHGACRWRPWSERLAAYASGSCERGIEASRTRMRTADWAWSVMQ